MGIFKGKQEAGVTESNKKEKPKDDSARDEWGSQIDFLLSCIGYAVGLGNIWRFPYLCMRNGGGAFLIPYFFFLIIAGIPLFFMELSLGQYASLSPVGVWKICPLFQGIGWSMLAVSAMGSFYYNIIISWVLYYLGHSFVADLPWGSCGHWWNTPDCLKREHCNNETMAGCRNDTLALGNSTTNTTNTPAEEFWQYNVLQLSPGLENLGNVRWQLLLCLFSAWLIVFLCLFKGVKSLGKVVYVTATAPYILLTTFLIRGLLLPGAIDGIKYYITPDFSKLAHFKVWAEGCMQIFFSLGPGWGGLITMASYNKFNNNCYRDALVVPLVNCLTSFYAGFVIFSVLGFMAHEANLPVKDVVTSGPGLAFMVYPEAITHLPISPLWAVLFFLCLLTIGLDSQFTTFETVVSGFADHFPKYLQKRKTLFTGFTCLVFFIGGLPLVTEGGMYVFQLLDWYVAAFTVFVVSLLECFIVGWVYGINRFCSNIECMIGFRPSIVWKICWCGVTPVTMLVILLFNLVTYDVPSYGEYQYPAWARGIGWLIGSITCLPIVAIAVYSVSQEKGPLLQRIKKLLKPASDWGPAEQRHGNNPVQGVPLMDPNAELATFKNYSHEEKTP